MTIDSGFEPSHESVCILVCMHMLDMNSSVPQSGRQCAWMLEAAIRLWWPWPECSFIRIVYL